MYTLIASFACRDPRTDNGKKPRGKRRLAKAAARPVATDGALIAVEPLLAELRPLIEAPRQRVARVVNSAMVVTYWSIGDRIRRQVVGDARAEYGKQLVHGLARQLSGEFGAGFSRSNLFNMPRFAEAYPSFEWRPCGTKTE